MGKEGEIWGQRGKCGVRDGDKVGDRYGVRNGVRNGVRRTHGPAAVVALRAAVPLWGGGGDKGVGTKGGTIGGGMTVGSVGWPWGLWGDNGLHGVTMGSMG